MTIDRINSRTGKALDATDLMKRCSIAGCDRKLFCRGLCNPHYQRWLNSDDFEYAPKKTVDERLLASVRFVESGCWEWTGGKRHGYGAVYANGRHQGAHRVSYETFVGPIPDGLHIDHLCRNRACINPEHLEPVTPAENTRRVPKRPRKTHCPSGHPYDEANTRWYRGTMYCRACLKISNAKRRAS